MHECSAAWVSSLSEAVDEGRRWSSGSRLGACEGSDEDARRWIGQAAVNDGSFVMRRGDEIMGDCRGICGVTAVAVILASVPSGSGLRARQPAVDDRLGDTIEVSRTTDMGADSLTFGESAVVLTTTVFFAGMQDGNRRRWSVELEIPMTPRLATVASTFRNIRRFLERGVPPPYPPSPHAPAIRIDGHIMVADEYWFSAANRIFVSVFHQVRWNDNEWTCLNCARHVEIEDPFSRIVRARTPKGKSQMLSIRDLDCSLPTLGGLSCVDSELGHYTIPWLLVESIDTDVRLVVTMDQSYFRNSDNRSLTFKEVTVEARTNVFQVAVRQEDRVPRLGRFKTSMTPNLESVYTSLRYGVAVNRRFDFVPHAPLLHINGQRVHHQDSDFQTASETLLATIEEATQRGAWTCVRCAEYWRAGNAILRITKDLDREEARHTFSIGELDCRSLGDGRLECVDSEFGLFEIPWDDH